MHYFISHFFPRLIAPDNTVNARKRVNSSSSTFVNVIGIRIVQFVKHSRSMYGSRGRVGRVARVHHTWGRSHWINAGKGHTAHSILATSNTQPLRTETIRRFPPCWQPDGVFARIKVVIRGSERRKPQIGSTAKRFGR